MRVTIKCIVHHFCSLGLTLNVIKLSKLSFIICTLSSCYVVYVCLSLSCSLSLCLFFFSLSLSPPDDGPLVECGYIKHNA